jgi:hypothetical protein
MHRAWTELVVRAAVAREGAWELALQAVRAAVELVVRVAAAPVVLATVGVPWEPALQAVRAAVVPVVLATVGVPWEPALQAVLAAAVPEASSA